MKNQQRSLTSLLLAIFLLASPNLLTGQSSQVPNLVNYQGFVTDNDGNPLANTTPENKTVEFRLYESANGGDELWGETQVVTVFKGNFSVLLGNGLEIDSETPSGGEALANAFNGDSRYLGVTLQGESEFSPRQRIVSTAFAFRSKVAESVESSTIGSLEIEDGSISVEDLVAEVRKQLMPAGTVVAWAGLPADRTIDSNAYKGVPDGWLICDGRTVSKTDYPGLFATIGYIHGGSGNNFQLPDFRGYFLRGQDSGSVDPNRTTRTKASVFATTNGLNEGSSQADQNAEHRHQNQSWKNYTVVTGGAIIGKTTRSMSLNTGSRNTTYSGGDEARPTNKYVWYIIKAD